VPAFTATSKPHVEVSGVQILCGCTPKQKAAPDWHARLNQVCPRPRGTINHGVLARVSMTDRIKRFFTKE
jgi:hypothetical protein